MSPRAEIDDGPPTLGLFIDGMFTRSHANTSLDVTDPSTGSVTARASVAGSRDVDNAVRSARLAFGQGSWSRWTRRERADVLLELAALVEEDSERLARIEAADTGLPIQLIQNGHLPRVVDNLRYFAGSVHRRTDSAIGHDEGFLNVVVEEPLGVVGVITPWNSPLSITSLSLGACIATGNTCVIKPSELAPLSVASLIVKLASLGLPPGVVNLINGGADTGSHLVRNPDVDGISFTGSRESGSSVMRIAGPRLARVTCELGGLASAIVMPGADLEAAGEGIKWSAFGSNGAACLTSSVIYAHRDVYEELAGRLVKRIDALRVGDPLDPHTDIGPLVNRQAKLRLQQQRDRLLAGGSTELHAERDPGPDGDASLFFAPSLLAVPSADLIPDEDITGPLALLCPFKDPRKLTSNLSNASSGLAAYVWGPDDQITRNTVRALRFGSVAWNAPIARDARTPFGGFRRSGIGRVGGAGWLDFWTETKSVTIRR